MAGQRKKILVINPNTSRQVSESIATMARAEARDDDAVEIVTARFGFGYISSRAAIAIAAHAVLDAVAQSIAAVGQPDAIVVACFGDPGVEAVREMTGLPTFGFAEAGLMEATALPGRFLVATSGGVWRDVLAELAHKLGVAERLAAIMSIEDIARDAIAIGLRIGEAAEATAAARVVLGGAGLIPIMEKVAAASPLPVLDPHRAAMRAALASARTQPPPRSDTAAMEVIGLSHTLHQLLTFNCGYRTGDTQ